MLIGGTVTKESCVVVEFRWSGFNGMNMTAMATAKRRAEIMTEIGWVIRLLM